MNAQKTISDSKELFYKEFPYVIPHIYRRVADELIVELHLISHLSDFKQDELFAAGLNKTFEDLTKGYRPIEHLEKLFNAICKCSGFDALKIKDQAKRLKLFVQELEIDKFEELLKGETKIGNYKNNDMLKSFENNSKYHSRLFSIGILNLISQVNMEQSNNEKVINYCKALGKYIGYSEERIEKDISSYLRSIEKIDQFMELQKELNKKKIK